MITLALSKGRILDECLPLLEAAGIAVLEDPETSRKLILATSRPDVRVVLVRASDVPTYVQYGGADLGVAGKDILLEHSGEGLYQPLDLKIGRCRMSVATRADFDYASAIRQGSRIRVATKYTAVARQHFADKGVHVDLIKLYGSMELAPLTGLADAIVELTETGSSLRANNLRVVETILESTTVLIANREAWKDPWKRQKIENIALLLQGALRAEETVGLKMNVGRGDLDRILKVLPAMQNPTISSLSEAGWFSLEVIVDQKIVRDLIPVLKKEGASGIVEYPLNKVIP